MEEKMDRRTRKRLLTRQTISDAATRLFFERGFDRVTVDEIAEAADVGRMTVFSHFPRKEDMFFDRDEEIRLLVLEALGTRDVGVTPVAALHRLVQRLVAEDCGWLRFSEATSRFVEVVEESGTLVARARAIRDEAARFLATAMAEAVGRSEDEPEVLLAAGLIMATVSVAFVRAHAVYRRSRDEKEARDVLLALLERGMSGAVVALKGTPYGEPEEV